MLSKKQIAFTLPVIAIAMLALLAFRGRKAPEPFQHDSGLVFGTSYNITYQSDTSLKADIEQALAEVNSTLSPFEEASMITKVNNNADPKVDSMFISVFQLAQAVSADTDGAFDITVAPLVNAWGFGFKNGTMPGKQQIDSIMAFIGHDKVMLKDLHIVKQDPRTMLDCSAIAKGYGVDHVANLLHSKGVRNFMVEIGGEIVARGTNRQGDNWHIGVTKPTDDSLATTNELQTVLSLTDMAMATSGNYRNFYYKDGKKYAHTIDPHTGMPVQHSILSATVIAPTCAKADAYATAFMVSGMDKTQQILSRNPDLAAYLIYTDSAGNYKVWHSERFNTLIADK